MKPADKAAIYFIPASVLLPLGVFARSLGLLEPSGVILFVAALLLILLGYRELSKPRQSGQLEHRTSNSSRTISKRRILPNSALQPQGAGGGEADHSSIE